MRRKEKREKVDGEGREEWKKCEGQHGARAEQCHHHPGGEGKVVDRCANGRGQRALWRRGNLESEKRECGPERVREERKGEIWPMKFWDGQESVEEKDKGGTRRKREREPK